MLPIRQAGARFGVREPRDNAADLCLVAPGLPLERCRWSGGATGEPSRSGHPEIFRLDDMSGGPPGRAQQDRHFSPDPGEYTNHTVSPSYRSHGLQFAG